MKNPMPKAEMEKELRRLLSVLMSGTRDEFKKAKKEIEILNESKFSIILMQL